MPVSGGAFDGAHDVAAGSASGAVVAVEVADGRAEFGDDGQFVAVEAELGEGRCQTWFLRRVRRRRVNDVEETDAGAAAMTVGAFLGSGGVPGRPRLCSRCRRWVRRARLSKPAVDGRFNTFHAFNSTLLQVYLPRLFPSSWEAKELSEA